MSREDITHPDLWDAIHHYVRLCGGDPDALTKAAAEDSEVDRIQTKAIHAIIEAMRSEGK